MWEVLGWIALLLFFAFLADMELALFIVLLPVIAVLCVVQWVSGLFEHQRRRVCNCGWKARKGAEWCGRCGRWLNAPPGVNRRRA